MAEDATVEQIILELKTNFSKELQRGLKEYSNFVIKIGESSRSIESSWSDMHKSVTNQMKSMFGGTAKQIQEMVTQSRYAMKQVMTQGVSLNQAYLNSFDKLVSAQDQFISKINSTERKLEALRKLEARGTSVSPKIQTKIKDVGAELEAQRKELISELSTLQSQIRNEFFKRMGAIAQTASKSLIEGARNQLASLKGVTKDVITQLDMVRNRMGMQDDVSKIFRFQEQFEAMKSQYVSLQKTLQQQRKMTAEHEKQMKKAEFAYISATDEQIKQKNFEIYRTTIANNKIIQQSYNDLTKEVYDYSKALDKTEAEMQQMAVALRKSIQQGIRPQDLTERMKKAMNLLVEYARNSGKGMSDALIKNISQSREVETAIQRDVEKLKQMRAEAVALQKTGLVDVRAEVSRIDTILAKYRTFWKEYKQQQGVARSVLGGGKIDIPRTGTLDLAKLRKEFGEINAELNRFGKIQADNVLEANTKVQEMIRVWDRYKVKRKQVQDEIVKLEKRMHQVEIAMSKTTNAELLNEYTNYYNQLKAKLALVMREFKDRPLQGKGTIDESLKTINNTVNQITNNIKKKFLESDNYIEKSFQNIKAQYDSLIAKTAILTKRRFVGKDQIEEAKRAYRQIIVEAEKYEKQIRDIQIEIKRLEQLQKAGLGGKGIQAMTEKLRANIATMRSHTQQLNIMSTQAQRNIDRLTTRTLGGMTKQLWYFIRDFRWQVAAIVYLFSKAGNAIRRVFFNIIDEIQAFRKDAMSIAAGISFKLVGEMQDNYKRAYEYSRDLMVKLQFEAARTILTMEDMLMLTKTLTQAGIIPKTDEDVRRISDIGIAIKALTEGMANAGVQMRQELYAVISGRQRATDQLAMMFKMMGVNIKTLLKDVKKADFLKVLSDQLKPFREMNKMMQGEYVTAVNKLKEVWKLIKRIGGEQVLLQLAKDINAIVDRFIDMKDFKLTEEGEKAVALVKGALLLMIQIGKSVLGVIESVAMVFANIFGIVDDIGIAAGLWQKNLKQVDGTAGSLFRTMKGLANILLTIQLTFENLSTTINWVYQHFRMLVKGAAILGKVMAAIVTRDWDYLKQVQSEASDLNKDFFDSYSDMLTMVDRNAKAYDDLNGRVNEVANSVNNITKASKGLGDMFELPHIFDNIKKDIGKVVQKTQELRKASLEGPAKFKYEYEVEIGGREELKKQIQDNIAYYNKWFDMIADGTKKVPKEQQKLWHEQVGALKEALGNIVMLNEAAYDKMIKKTKDWNKKTADQLAQQKRQWDTFLVQLENSPQTRQEKLDQWAKMETLRIVELVQTNKYGAEESKKAWDAFYKGYENRSKANAEMTKNEYDSLVQSLTSHRVLNEYEKINNEYEKILIKINKNINLNDKQRDALEKLFNITKAERIELENINQTYRNQAKQLDIIGAKASFLQNAWSPIKQQQGDILELRKNYVQAAIDIRKEIQKVELEYMSDGKWSANSKHAQEYADLLKQEFGEIQKAFERDLWRKQHPLWSDMMDMSKNWADGLSDSLADLVLDFENFSDSIKSLWQSVIRDVTKATISRTITQPLMEGLGSGEPGSPNKIWDTVKGWFGGGGEEAQKGVEGTMKESQNILDQMLQSNTPIPVYIVEAPPVKDVQSAVATTTQAMKDNTVANENGFKNNQSVMSQIVSAIMSSSVGQSASSGFSSFAGLFSGGGAGGGMNTGAPAHVGAGGTTAFGMQEGGTISEHIVGKGLKSGKVYEFGERSRYGEFEDVVPRSKMKNQGGGQSVTMSMPININALDTRSGVEFVMQNQKLIETNMLRSMKNNKAIRGMIKGSW